MHQAIASVSPLTALNVGLKLDVEALPAALIAALQAGQVDLNDPAVTIELLRLNAVVGVMGKVDDLGQLTRVGTTCALCHSTVDNSFTTGIGKSSHAEAAGPAGVSAQPGRADSPERQLQCRSSETRRTSVSRQSELRQLPHAADLHRRLERPRSRRAISP